MRKGSMRSRREETVTKSGFARVVGSTPREVQRQLARGLPVTPKGRIPLKAGRKWWRENRQQRINSRGNGKPPKAESYAGARAEKMVHDARRAAAEAERAELELKVRNGQMVPIADVRKEWFRVVRIIRDRVQAIPDRLCARLAAEFQVGDAGRVRQILAAEIDLALEAVGAELVAAPSEEDPPPEAA